MADKEFTYQDVAEHNTKKDIYVVIHDKVYNCSQFLDEHPGGEEVLLDVAGQDATEAFEDVGHSDEARETLDKLIIGTLKRQPEDPVPKTVAKDTSASSGSSGPSGSFGLYSFVFIGGFIAYIAYWYLQTDASKAQNSA